MNKNKQIISVTLGIFVIVGAFLSVFGPILKNVTVKDAESKTDLATDLPATVTTAVGNQTQEPKTNTENTSKTQTDVVSAYTLADISDHNSATSCWSAINGNVYDLTKWVNAHPGGRAAILMICGKDGSPLFDMQHGSEKKPASILAGYKIGSLQG